MGDEAIIPDLAAQLHSPQLQGPATDALWAVFQRSRNPAVNELIAQGSECMGSSGKYERALGLFEEAIRLEPSFAEVRVQGVWAGTMLALSGTLQQTWQRHQPVCYAALPNSS